MRSNPRSFLRFVSRLFSSSSASTPTKSRSTPRSTKSAEITPPKLKNICYRHRARALKEARLALTEYLHSTRSLPFSIADHIAANSPFSLSLLLSQVHFTPPSDDHRHPFNVPSAIPRLLRRHLSYHPVNEFDFLSESIGLRSPIPSPSLFLSDHPRLLPAVSALALFGFPWTHLGLLYPHRHGEGAIFRQDAAYLSARLRSFEALGFRRVCVIGVCLAFPWVLVGDGEEEVDLLFRDLRTVFVDFGLDVLAGEDVNGVYEICRRIRVFYDAGARMGTMGELMGRNLRVFLEMGEEVLMKNLDFFIKLGMRKEEAGVFVLQHSEILNIDLECQCISMPEYLIGVGFCEQEATKVSKKYPYAMGKNKLGNLPGILRAMDLHCWFLDKVADGGNLRYLTPEYTAVSVESCDKMIEDEFLNDIERIKSKKKEEHVDNKLEFFFTIGFGKNKFAAKTVSAVNSTNDQLQERFDYLIEAGIEYSILCRMISATPKLINQSTESIQEKVNFLCHDLGYPLDYLNSFPAFLCFDLENRIKPRFRILNWLKENGLLKKQFSPATVLANAERRFIINLYGIHPAAPKQWLETFSSKSDHYGNQRNLFAPHS